MFSVFLQNLVLILVTLLISLNHKADYTLFMHGSNSTKINYFLLQSFTFYLVCAIPATVLQFV